MQANERTGALRAWRALRIGYWMCFLIAVAVVVRRIFVLAALSSTPRPEMGGLDAAFASRAALTLAHILPALAFVLLTPFVLFRVSVRSEWPERLLFPLGALVGLTAYAMSRDAVGGWTERSAVLFFNSLFLLSLIQAYRYRRGGDPTGQRRWLMRAIGILLGIATTRPVVGVFFATRSITHLQPSEFFGLAFWIGFSINTAVVEWWLAAEQRAALSGHTALPIR